MHVCTGPHNPHADGGNKNRNKTDPKVTSLDTFGWPIWLRDRSSYQRRHGK